MADTDDAVQLPGPDVEDWLGLIERAERDQDGYRKRCGKIRRKYKYEQSQQARKRRFAMMWANIETLKPATLARMPKPVVENRWKDGDPVADVSSQMLERTISFQFERCGYDTTFKQVRDDYLLFARGMARFRYEPIWDKDEIAGQGQGDNMAAPQEHPDAAAAMAEAAHGAAGAPGGTPAAEQSQQRILRLENVRFEYLQPADVIHPKCRTWPELPWLVFRSYLTRKELVKRFGEKGKKIGLDAKSDTPEDSKQTRPSDSSMHKATIFEVWDKTRQKVLWIAKAYKDVLEEDDPYLKVDGFFPCPRPAYGTLTNDSLEPAPDYVFYQDQAEEIDGLTARIAALQDSLKLVGFYPAGPEGEGAPEVERAVTPGVENRMIAVKSWAAFTDQGKGGAPIIWLPVDMVIKILEGCVQLRKELVDDVHQITGISDLMRGDTDPEETATAQSKKSSYTSARMKDRQDEMARFCRDATRMAGEIVANHFHIDSLMKCSNVRLPSQMDEMQQLLRYRLTVQQWQATAMRAQQMGQQPPASPPPPPDMGPTQEDVIELLRDDVTRRFRLDIETDSTILADDQLERKSRTEFLTAATQVVVAWAPIVKEMPAAVQLFGSLLLFGIRGFKVARDLETTVEKFIEQMEQQAAQSQGQPPPIPPVDQAKIQIAKIKAQSEQQRGAIDIQQARIAAAAEGQKAQLAVAAASQKAAADMQNTRAEADNTRMQHEANVADHNMTMAEHQAKQDLLSQQVQMQENRMVARQALGLMKPPPGSMPQ